ncbi:MAG: hypothetical protein JXJ20_11580 [Anaerolineae bacterium]|nr:hypothetical protein [Anaerolineae bacterium]
MTVWANNQSKTLSLDGEWAFTLGDQSGAIQVPGCWEAQGYARRVDGPATYRRVVQVPAEWAGQRVQLQFDAVSYYAEISVNGRAVGTHTGTWTAFAFDVTDAIRPGDTNEIAVTVWKPGERFPLRESLAGFLPDVCVMFGGLWQPVRLVAFSGPAFGDISVRAHLDTATVTVSTQTYRAAAALAAAVAVRAPDGTLVASWREPLTDAHFSATLAIPGAIPWQPDNPKLYTVDLSLEGPDGVAARVFRRVGFRTLSHAGDQLLLNGDPIMLRGALNWGWCPDLLCPIPDDDTIRDEFRRIRELGFNMMKLCLYVPWRRYFEIADEEGMLLWLELPLWLPEITPRLEQQALAEYDAIAAAAHHHPSIVIYSLGCELESNVNPDWLEQLNTVVRARLHGVLVCDNSGSGEAYGCLTDLADFEDYHFYCDMQFFDALVDHFHRDWRVPRPLIFGEFCDADDYREVGKLIAANDGQPPWWLVEQNPLHPLSKIAFSQQIERMHRVEMGVDAATLVRISRQQGFAVRKAILEKVRARSGMGGYVITGLRDTPLATSAMFDDFDRSKYPPDAVRMINTDSVLLLGRGRARVWSHDGDRIAPSEPYCFPAGQPTMLDIVLSHAGKPLPGGLLTWTITQHSGDWHVEGSQDVPGPLPDRGPHSIARFIFDAPPTDKAMMLTCEVTLETGRQTIRNRWPLWVFPQGTQWPEGIGILDPAGAAVEQRADLWDHAVRVGDRPTGDIRALITTVFNAHVRDFLRGGGSVLLWQGSDRPLPAVTGPFWRGGTKVIADHPVTNAMPHAGFVDLQFYGLATPWALDPARLADVLPDITDVRWLLRRLDNSQFTVADYLAEARLGTGRLFATTLRFQGGLGDQPAGLRFNLAGRWLLRQILEALVSGEE